MPTNTKHSIALPSKPVYKRKLMLAAAISSLLVLGACAQQSEPNYYEISRDSTQSDARHRAQGNEATVAPSQLQIGFGNQQERTNPYLEGKSLPANKKLPARLADTRTYLGTVACTSSAACSVQRMTLTIAPDGQWRARNSTLDGQLNDVLMGCWVLSNDDPIRINLKTGDSIFATMEFTRANVLQLVRLNGKQPLLQSSLTRQADVDPIGELADKPAQNCSIQN